jgi:putative ABC transport system permease protein
MEPANDQVGRTRHIAVFERTRHPLRHQSSSGRWQAKVRGSSQRRMLKTDEGQGRDHIRHNAARFALTTVGIGLLLMLVMGMSGIYRGLVVEATLLVDRIGADLWIVQGSTRGPFAEISRVPVSLEDRALAVPGVVGARRFVFHTIQRERRGQPLRIVVQGLAWPQDHGDWIPLDGGRSLRQAHYEMIADRSLGLSLGEKVKLGKDA